MTTNLLEIILQDTFIKSLALKRITVLRNYLVNKMFKGDEEAQIATWVLKLDPLVFANITQANIYATFEAMEATIKATEALVLYLPYELPEEEMRQIGTKLRTDYGPHFLMEVQIDPNLIAGCALSFKGIYKDLSVKQKIADHKSEILAEFGKYVKH